MGKTKKIVLISSIAVAILLPIGVFAFYLPSQNADKSPEAKTQDNTDGTSDPTSSSEKNNTPSVEEPTSDNADGSRNESVEAVDIGIAYAGVLDSSLEIRAFISGIIEGNGTCSATLKKNSLSVSGESTAFVDATTSQCNPIKIPLSDFPELGTWILMVNYESSDTRGASSPFEVHL